MQITLAVLIAALSIQLPASTTTPAVPSCPELATALAAVTRNDAPLRDWANLARYREANRTLPAPAAGARRVVFMGDSITDSWPQPQFGDFFTGKPYVCRGISGQTRRRCWSDFARTSSI